MILSHEHVKVPSLCPPGYLLEDSIFMFPSVEDMLDTVQSGHTPDYGDILSNGGFGRGGSAGWFGMEERPTREQLDRYVRSGYGADDEGIIDWGVPYSPQLGQIEPAVAGGVVNVPLYLSGDPACMMAPVIQDRPVDSLSITVPGTFACTVDAAAAKKRAAAIASYIPTLLDRGISLHVYGYCSVFAGDPWGDDELSVPLFLALTRVFSTDHAFDRAEVFLGCGSPVYCRYLCFLLMQWEAANLGQRFRQRFPAYGYSAALGAGGQHKEGGRRKQVEAAAERVEQILPTTHVIHMPELTSQANDKDDEWHYLFVRDTIDRFLRENGLG